MTRDRRTVVLPVVFALVVLSVPVQMAVVQRFPEPYPALLQPYFSGASQSTEATAVVLVADGRRVEPFDLFPADGPSRSIVRSMFPPTGGVMRVDDQARRAMRAALTRRLNAAPRELSVTWEKRRFDRETGRVVDRSVLTRYRLDLTGHAP